MKGCIIRNGIISLNGKIIYSMQSSSIEDFLEKAYGFFKVEYPKFHKMDLISKLGIITSSILFSSEENVFNPFDIGIILSSKNSCTHTDQAYINEIINDPYSSNPALFTYTLPSIVMGEICIKHKIQGENLFLIAEKFDEDLIENLAYELFDRESVKRLLLGWIDIENKEIYQSQFYFVDKKEKI